MEKEEVLTVSVHVTGMREVKGTKGEAMLLFFGGEAEGPYFTGTVLPGGIDTQKQVYGEARSLSARYILEGTDCKGNACHIFIENNGTLQEEGEWAIVPCIYTDSKELQFLEEAKLKGSITPQEGGVVIHIIREN